MTDFDEYDDGRPEDDMFFWKERDDLEFRRMVEKLYGADPPREDYDEPPEPEEDWTEEEVIPLEPVEWEDIGQETEVCTRGCIICLAGDCIYWV